MKVSKINEFVFDGNCDRLTRLYALATSQPSCQYLDLLLRESPPATPRAADGPATSRPISSLSADLEPTPSPITSGSPASLANSAGPSLGGSPARHGSFRPVRTAGLAKTSSGVAMAAAAPVTGREPDPVGPGDGRVPDDGHGLDNGHGLDDWREPPVSVEPGDGDAVSGDDVVLNLGAATSRRVDSRVGRADGRAAEAVDAGGDVRGAALGADAADDERGRRSGAAFRGDPDERVFMRATVRRATAVAARATREVRCPARRATLNVDNLVGRLIDGRNVVVRCGASVMPLALFEARFRQQDYAICDAQLCEFQTRDTIAARTAAWQELMIWAVLTNRSKLAEFFWERGGECP